MTGRARFYDVIEYVDPQTGAFRPVENPVVEVYEAGSVGTTEPLAQTIYAGATGGTTLPNPLTGDSDGTVEFYLPLGQSVKMVISGAGLGTQTVDYVAVDPAPEDVVTSLTVRDTSDWALSVQQLDADGRGFQVLGQADNPILRVGEADGIPFLSLNLVNSTDPVLGTNLLVVAEADENRVMADFGLTLTGTNNQDAGTARFTISTNSAGIKAIRALETHTFQNVGAVGTVGASVQEWGIHNRAYDNPNNHGVYVQSNTFAWYQTVLRAVVTAGGSGYGTPPTVTISAPDQPGGVQATATATVLAGAVTAVTITNGGSGYSTRPTISFSGGGGSGASARAYAGYKNGTAFWAFGEDEFTNFGELWDKDGASMWKVDGAGKTTGGSMAPRSNATYRLGDNGAYWLFAFAITYLAGDGSAASPAIVAGANTGSGFWWNGANPAVSVSGTQRGEWSASGLSLMGSAILQQISTPSAPSSGYTSVYSKTGGGIYSRANGGSEKQHKAGGQFAFASGSTSSPTTTSASYADLAQMAITLTTTGGDLRCKFAGAFAHSDATKSAVVALALDGGTETFAFSIGAPAANKPFMVTTMGRFTGVSAGSHTVKVRWLTDGATLTANGTDRYLEVSEEPQ